MMMNKLISLCFLLCITATANARLIGDICPQSIPCDPSQPAPEFCQKIWSDPDIAPLVESINSGDDASMLGGLEQVAFPKVCSAGEVDADKLAENIYFLKLSVANLCAQFEAGKAFAKAYEGEVTLATEAGNRVVCNARGESATLNNILNQTLTLANAYQLGGASANCANFEAIEKTYNNMIYQCDKNMSCQWDWMNYRNQEAKKLASEYGLKLGNNQVCTTFRLCSFTPKTQSNEPDCFWPSGSR